MRINQKGFSLMELIAAFLIMVTVIMGFYYVIRSTSLFVAVNKQEILIFRTVSSIRENLQTTFRGSKSLSSPESKERLSSTLLPPPFVETASGSFQDKTSTGAFSIKDDIADASYAGKSDLVAIEREDASLSGSVSLTETGVVMVAVVDKATRKAIDASRKRAGFLAIKNLPNGKNVRDYLETSTDTGAVFDETVFDDLNVRSFEYSIIATGSLLRLDIEYDNDIDGEYARMGSYDESYLSGTTFVLQPISFK